MEVYGYLYLVRNRANGKVYVGQTIRTPQIRWVQHLSQARNGRQFYLSAAIRKYGCDAFNIEPLAVCADKGTLNKLEHYFITQVFHSTNRLIGYNIAGGGNSLGSASSETKAKISAAHMGRKCSPEHVANIAAARRGWKFSEETKAKLRGRIVSDEVKAKIGAAKRGKPLSADHRAKLAAYRTGKKTSDETKAKQSAANLGKKYKPRVKNLAEDMREVRAEQSRKSE